LRDLRAFEPIAHILADPEADLFVREYAARSIGMLRDPHSAPLLIEVYRQPMSANEITTTIIKSAQSHFSGTAIPSIPLSEFLNQANRMFNINLSLTAVTNGMNDHLRHAIRQGLFELGTFAIPTLEQARYDSNPQIRALAEEVLNYVAR
jgi:HEAT repeat protein